VPDATPIEGMTVLWIGRRVVAMDASRAVTDADREAAVAALRTHAGTGAIDLDAFGARTERVLAAVTVADLESVFADLPGDAPVLPSSVPAPRPAAARRTPWVWARLAPVVPLALLFVAIWAVTGFGYFWPIWPIMGISIGALKGGRCWRAPHWA
jgi:hypothetical protein